MPGTSSQKAPRLPSITSPCPSSFKSPHVAAAGVGRSPTDGNCCESMGRGQRVEEGALWACCPRGGDSPVLIKKPWRKAGSFVWEVTQLFECCCWPYCPDPSWAGSSGSRACWLVLALTPKRFLPRLSGGRTMRHSSHRPRRGGWAACHDQGGTSSSGYRGWEVPRGFSVQVVGRELGCGSEAVAAPLCSPGGVSPEDRAYRPWLPRAGGPRALQGAAENQDAL